MTLRNLFLVAGLLCLLPAFLSGCGRNDAARYSSYSELPAEDGSAETTAADSSAADPTGMTSDADTAERTPGNSAAAGIDTAADTAQPGTTNAEPVAVRSESDDKSLAETDPAGRPEARGGEEPGAETSPAEQASTTIGTGADPTPSDKSDTVAVAGTTPAEGPQDAAPGKLESPEADKEPAEPRKVKVLVKSREFKEEGPEGAIRISFDDFDLLKVLNMDPVTANAAELMPKWLKDLDGKRVRVRGFMYPPFEETNLPFFVLARDNQICCFGRNPKIYDLVEVFMRKGVTTDYIQNRPFDVVGIFRINPAAEEGLLYQLYQLEDATVIEQH